MTRAISSWAAKPTAIEEMESRERTAMLLD
jgi:hypothetical protein